MKRLFGLTGGCLLAAVAGGAPLFEGRQVLGGFFLNKDGYVQQKGTSPVFDARWLDSSTTTTTTTPSTTDDDTTDTVKPEPRAARAGLDGEGDFDADLDAKMFAEREYIDVIKGVIESPNEAGPVEADDDVLLSPRRNPIDDQYVDNTEYGKWIQRNYTLHESGWDINVKLRSRSKRCQTYNCPVTVLSSLASLSSCMGETAPGCAMHFELDMRLNEDVYMCCFDKNDLDDTPQHYGNYTWLLPTPPIAVELALKGNVTTEARVRAAYEHDGFMKPAVLSGGFGITKMTGGCGEFRDFDAEGHIAHIANPVGCTYNDTFYECAGWSSLSDVATWNKTNAQQLVFTAVLNATNCLTAAAQLPLSHASLRFGTLVY